MSPKEKYICNGRLCDIGLSNSSERKIRKTINPLDYIPSSELKERASENKFHIINISKTKNNYLCNGRDCEFSQVTPIKSIFFEDYFLKDIFTTETEDRVVYGVIYCILNKTNNKKYIGQTIQVPRTRRWIQHKQSAKKGRKGPLYNAMRYYGIQNFEFYIIEDKVPVQELNQKEMKFIEENNTNIHKFGRQFGYNQGAGGNENRKVIEIEVLKDLILRGYKEPFLSQELNVSENSVQNWCRRYWNVPLGEARRFLMKEKIEELIVEGYSLDQMAEEFNMGRQFVSGILEEYLNVKDMHSARALFRKPIIEDLLKKGTSLNDISEKLNTSTESIQRHINEYWGKTYSDAKYEFMKDYIKQLVENGLTESEIIKELAIKEDNYTSIRRYFLRFWNMNYVQAREEFLIKPTVKNMIEEGASREDIAAELSMEPRTISDYCSRYWNMTFRDAQYRFYYESQIKNLIEEGASRDDIAAELSVEPKTISNYCKLFWNMTFRDTQLHFFYEPQLKEMICKNFPLEIIAKELKKDSGTIVDWCKKLYNMNFQDAKEYICNQNQV